MYNFIPIFFLKKIKTQKILNCSSPYKYKTFSPKIFE